MKESYDSIIEDKMGLFVSGFEWLEKKINKDLAMLQERNSVLERQLNRVLRSNLDKDTPFKTKEKRKRNSSSDIVDEFDIKKDNRKRSEKIDKANSIKYFDILRDSESQEDLGKSQLESQPSRENKSSEMKSVTLPQSKETDNDNVILTAKKNNDYAFKSIICKKSFLCKHNIKVHDKRFHPKPGSYGTFKCDK